MATKKSDAPLIARALAGDQKAYAELMARHRGPLYNLLHNMVHNREEAEDLLQEAFMKAFAALHTFNREFAFSTWLYKIAINTTIDHLRKKKLQTYSLDKPIQSSEGELKREYADVHAITDNELLSTEKSSLIAQAIAELPPRYREAIILRHTEEKSYEEIAQITGVPLGTVKARIFRAREMLKHKLKGKLLV
ncbi:MAG: sigma-70 family RNA polymerase sigma factor [candidate division KSB1 bacterium]|nr:sigma-70 family RNA polymerase sigma factor [candidate division KSB1 bacterium]MDZ7275852.1 sigma-70 family RNA polymerase sigma factor [candidate division KSB1 bacterium]MDZ7287602.1 sigma-70 family RNA polymerase sigma factor [candidate division KSB1 bacterium]MDZ7306494.1 sigma-70 family RNA polymerase sigma factor [candidate division KSB1 bacterium]MDZ7350580.1 sigma-70 family RNA polymerase sigma factor [candidate division KSB1 bacterium]